MKKRKEKNDFGYGQFLVSNKLETDNDTNKATEPTEGNPYFMALVRVCLEFLEAEQRGEWQPEQKFLAKIGAAKTLFMKERLQMPKM